jgi:hypothetical protein
MFEEALALFRERGSNWLVSNAVTNLSNVMCRQGEYNKATDLLREGLTMRLELGDKQGMPLSMIGLAGVAAGIGKPKRAARLLSAADKSLRMGDFVLWPSDRNDYEYYLEVTMRQLDEATWQAAWEEGQAMSTEDAIEYALQER